MPVSDDNAVEAPERPYSNVLQCLPWPAWLATPTGQVVEINAAWTAVLGQSPETARGVGWLGAFPPSERLALARHTLHGRLSGTARTHLAGLASGTELERWALIHMAPLGGTASEPWWLGVVIDVSANELDPASPRDAEHRAKSIIHRLALSWFDWSLHTGKASHADELPSLLGSSVAEAGDLRNMLVASAHDDEAASVTEALDALVRGSQDAVAIRYRAKRMPERFLYVNAWVYDDAAGRRIVGTVRDATADVAREEERHRRQDLAELGVMAGGIAHDLGNSLGSVQSLLALALRDLASGKPIEARLRQACDETERASALTRSILTRVRRAPRHVEPFDLASVARDACGVFQTRFGPNTDMVLDLEASPLITGDQGEFYHVISNLIINAHDAFDGAPGTICVQVRPATPGEVASLPMTGPERAQRGTALLITDDGPGMAAEVALRIFEPRYSTKGSRGSGLGLSRVRAVVLDHFGEVRVASSPGRGTSFRIVLPASEQGGGEDVHVPVARAAPIRAADGLVVVVDDEEVIAELTAVTLEGVGFTVRSFVASEAAAAFIAEHAAGISVLVTDLRMEGRSGRDLHRALRERNPHARVIITTGYVEEREEHELLGQGVQAVLVKPVTRDELLAELGVE